MRRSTRRTRCPPEAALIDPLITREPLDNRTSTRVQLVGPHPDPPARAEWSVEEAATTCLKSCARLARGFPSWC